MKSKVLMSLAFGLSTVSVQAAWDPGLRWGDNEYDMRCASDSLTPSQARGRVLWSTNKQGVETAQYFSYITTGTTDYVENFGTLEDALDAVKKDWLYVGRLLRPRPQYPLWGIGDKFTGQIWSAPTDENSNILAPADAHPRMLCTSSCFRPEVRIFYPAGYTPIKEAFDKRLPNIVTLDENATLDQLSFKVSAVNRYTTEVKDAWNDITHIKTASGGELQVTVNHPLVDGHGVMREAQSFQIGDELIRSDGSRDPIISLETNPYFGKVYNVSSADKTLRANVIVAEGYLSGNAWYQNDGALYLNRDIFRYTLPDSLVD